MKSIQNFVYSREYRPMIYISAHPADFQAHFQSIRQDLFDLTQCILYYDPDPDHPEDLSRFVSDLSQMNLIILPITQKFLREESFARDWILRLIEKLHLPFLPICADQDGFPFLQKYIPAFHALARFCEDPKEPSFLQKLQDYLNTLFPSSRQIQDVQAALSQNLWMQNVDTGCSDPFNDSSTTPAKLSAIGFLRLPVSCIQSIRTSLPKGQKAAPLHRKRFYLIHFRPPFFRFVFRKIRAGKCGASRF